MIYTVIFLAALSALFGTAFVAGWFVDVSTLLSNLAPGFFDKVPWWVSMGITGFVIVILVFGVNVFSGRR